MREAFEVKLRSSSFTPERSASLAWMIISAVEGAIILSRTYHSGDPLRTVAKELACVLRSCEH